MARFPRRRLIVGYSDCLGKDPGLFSRTTNPRKKTSWTDKLRKGLRENPFKYILRQDFLIGPMKGDGAIPPFIFDRLRAILIRRKSRPPKHVEAFFRFQARLHKAKACRYPGLLSEDRIARSSSRPQIQSCCDRKRHRRRSFLDRRSRRNCRPRLERFSFQEDTVLQKRTRNASGDRREDSGRGPRGVARRIDR